MRSARIFALYIFVFVFLPSAIWAGYRMAPESAPVARGAAYAQVRGCIDCHGDPENPRTDANDAGCTNTNRIDGHSNYDVDCAAVMAYFETVRLRRSFDTRMLGKSISPLAAGEKLARKYYCFQCHGPLGQGGFANSKSLKGYVPGYFGADFRMLTRNADPDSVRAWITEGVDSAMLDEPVTGRIAEFFLAREEVSMPSYKSLDPVEIEILVNYVIAINQFGPMTAQTVRLYGEQSTSK